MPPVWPCGTAEQVGELCGGIAVRTVHALAKAGTIPPPERPNWYNLPACVKAYWAYRYHQRRPDTLTDDARYDRAKADEKEIEVDVLTASLIPYDHAETVTTEALGMVRSECDGNAGRLAPELAAISDAAVIRRVLLDAYRASCDRAALKVAELRPPVLSAPEASGDDADTATESDGG